MSIKYTQRNCPGCNSKPPQKPHIFAHKEAEYISFEDIQDYWVGLFNKKSHFNYYRCESCGLLFNKYYFTNKQLRKLYSNLEPNMSQVTKPLLLKTQNGYTKILKYYSSLTGNYLEIGPDVGLFLESNKASLMNYENYYLYEPNLSVHSELKTLLADKNFFLNEDMNGFSKLTQNIIDDVVMIHVLDHIVDPYQTLVSLSEKLIKGGRVLIVTHDEQSLLKKLVGKRWPPFCLQHPQIYSQKSIKKILNRAGFSVVHSGKTKNFFSLNYLLKHALWLVGIKIEHLNLFGKLSIGLKLGNIITVAIKE